MSSLPNGTDIQIARDSIFSNLVLDVSTAYCTSRNIPVDSIPYGVSLYTRVRHHHPDTGVSNWSATSAFRVAIPSWVIGICLDNSTTIGTFYWIDALGNKVDSFDYTTNPVFQGITTVTLDTSRDPVTMLKIPLFYVKTAASGPVGTFAAGKKCWWISNSSENGFRPAACFKRTTTKNEDGKYIISPFVYWAAYLAHTPTIGSVKVLGSTKNVRPIGGLFKTTCRTYAKNRNNAATGISGFRMFDIWDLGALRLLALIMKAKSDTQTVFGNNLTVNAAPYTGTTACSITFNTAIPVTTITDLWAGWWCYVDYYKVSSTKVVSLLNPMDINSILEITFTGTQASYTQSCANGYIKDVMDCSFGIGDDVHDLMELFLPKTTSTSQSTFSDGVVYYSSDVEPEEYVCFGGTAWPRSGYWSPTQNGLFAQGSGEYDYDISDISSRLAKS